jgi:hypothetical protein
VLLVTVELPAELVTTAGVSANDDNRSTGAQASRIQLLHVQDCPRVGGLRELVQMSLDTLGSTAMIEEIEGPYPSPTLLINGEDVTGRATGSDPSCRLDLPTTEQILAAIAGALAGSERKGANQGEDERGWTESNTSAPKPGKANADPVHVAPEPYAGGRRHPSQPTPSSNSASTACGSETSPPLRCS